MDKGKLVVPFTSSVQLHIVIGISAQRCPFNENLAVPKNFFCLFDTIGFLLEKSQFCFICNF